MGRGLLFACFIASCSGFSPLVNQGIASTDLNLVDPGSLADVGVIVASAAAGALSQLPRISSLQRELEETKALLAAESEKVTSKMEELETKMFQMDQEFEEQTARFKKSYDAQAKIQLEERLQKIKADYDDSLATRTKQIEMQKDVALKEERSKVLVDALGQTDSHYEISKLRLQNVQMIELNKQLDAAVESANQELERLRCEAADASTRKKRFLLF